MEVPERKNNLFKAVLSSNATEISIEQRSQKWFQWRKEGVTATEAVVITKGEHFGKTVSTLFDEKTGKVEIRNISNQYIQRGIAFEESVLQFFSTHRNVRVKNSGCYQNKISASLTEKILIWKLNVFQKKSLTNYNSMA